MPLWKIYHPADAYTPQDKQDLAEKITSIYAQIPIPKFYTVVIFDELPGGSCFVGGQRHDRFVRIKVDQMARTLPGADLREWWVTMVDEAVAPWVGGRGFDWEITIDELPADLWILQGELPPPFESVAEKRWVAENKASPYTRAEKLPAQVSLAPGVSGG